MKKNKCNQVSEGIRGQKRSTEHRKTFLFEMFGLVFGLEFFMNTWLVEPVIKIFLHVVVQSSNLGRDVP